MIDIEKYLGNFYRGSKEISLWMNIIIFKKK